MFGFSAEAGLADAAHGPLPARSSARINTGVPSGVTARV
jgi:hypothetical protein